MHPHDQQMFEANAARLAFELGMKNALVEAAKLLGTAGPTFIDRIKADLETGVKNFSPSPNVPDAVMQSSVRSTLVEIDKAFADVRQALGLPKKP